MEKHEIIPLRCPACSGAINQPTRETTFGAEFRCEICGITSVLIINQALVPLSTLQKLGIKVCTICGRVAQSEARFCQEGHALIRKCLKCLKEFAVDHQRCDFCGWIQSVNPNSDGGVAIAFEGAINDLADPDWDTMTDALKFITREASNTSDANVKAAVSAIHNLMIDPMFIKISYVGDKDHNFTERLCWEALGSLGPSALSTIISIINNPSFCRSSGQDWDFAHGANYSDEWSLKALSSLGTTATPAILNIMKDHTFKRIYDNKFLINTLLEGLGASVQQAVPILRQQLEEIWTSRWKGRRWELLFECLSTVSPKDALSFCSRSLEAWDKNDSELNVTTLWATSEFGKTAIPTLEKFCGFFSGRRGKACAKVISELRNGSTSVTLGSWDC
jgi:hypothetical protein